MFEGRLLAIDADYFARSDSIHVEHSTNALGIYIDMDITERVRTQDVAR